MNPVPKGTDPRLQAGHGVNLVTLVLVGGLTAALFGSRVLLQEIRSQPDMIGYDLANELGSRWNDAMHKVRATLPDRVLHDAMRGGGSKQFFFEKKDQKTFILTLLDRTH